MARSTHQDDRDETTDGGSRTSSRVQRDEPARSNRRGRHGRRTGGGDTRRAEGLLDEIMELQQGVLHATIEAASSGIDTATRVTRNTVDRAFAKDYRDPGDLLRNVGKDADETARDVLDGLRDGPRRMHDGFYDAVRASSRSRDRGERHRRAQGEDE